MSVFAPAIRAFTSIESIGPLTSKRVLEYLGGGPTLAGPRVNLDTAMGIPAAYACNRVIAEGVASLPLHTYKRLEPRGRQLAPEHPTFRLLAEEPNPWMSSYKFRETQQGQVGWRGNFFAEIERDFWGRPINLWPLRADCMDRPEVVSAGTLVYPYKLPSGNKVGLPQHLVLHLRGLSSDGLWGYSPITVFRETFGHAMAVREHGARYFGQGAEPGGILQTKARLSDETADRIDKSWTAAHEGLDKRWRIAILEEGVEWKQVGMSNEDSQFIETQSLTILDFCRIFRMQPHKVAEMTHSTFTNVEAQNIEHVTDTLMPWIVNSEQEYHRSLFLPAERRTYYPKHTVTALLRGDMAAQANFFRSGVAGGWFSPDDVREWLELNPIPDGKGDVYFRQLNMVAVGDEDEPAEPETDTTPAPQARGVRKTVERDAQGRITAVLEEPLPWA